MAEGFEISGLDELMKGFEKAIAIAPEKHHKLMGKLGDQVFKNGAEEVKNAGAVDEGRLLSAFQKKAWKGKKEFKAFNNKKKKNVYCAVTVPYAHLVELGHVQKHKKKDGTIVETGIVAGRLIFKAAMDKTEKEIPEAVELFIEDVVGGIFR